MMNFLWGDRFAGEHRIQPPKTDECPTRGSLPRRPVPHGHAPAATRRPGHRAISGTRPARSRATWFRGKPLPEAQLVCASRSPARDTLPRRLVPRGHAPAATCPARSHARGDSPCAVTRYMVSGAVILRMERTFSRTVLAATQRESRACVSDSCSPNTLQAV